MVNIMKTKIIQPTLLAHEHQLLIKQILMSSQRYEPDNEIVYKDISRYSYRDFYKRVCQLANFLTKMGVKAGDTVAVMEWDTHRYLECYFAVPMIGAVLHHINARLSPEQILYTMNHAEDDYLLINEDFVDMCLGFSDQVTTLKRFVVLTDNFITPAWQAHPLFYADYEQEVSVQPQNYEFADFSENSVATLCYTTGTTGSPKGVYFTHRQIVLHTMNQLGTFTAYEGFKILNSDSVYMPLTPLFHIHAWGVPYTVTMLGAKQVYPGKYEPDTIVDLYKKEHVDFSHCVPTVLQMVLKSAQAKSIQLKNWNMIIGGSALTTGLANEAIETGINVFSGYGLSETGPIISVTKLNKSIRSRSTQEQVSYRIKSGLPLNFVDVKLLDENGRDVPKDGVSQGEIVVRSPWLTQGYYKDSEQSQELWRSGWLHTGDIATIDDENYICLKDRLKDVIKTGGEWISSIDLESLISRHTAVAEVAVVGIEDKVWGERPFALVVPHPGKVFNHLLLTEHLMQFVNSGLINKWWIPSEVQCVEIIPKTSIGKLDKKVIRQHVTQGAAV